MAHDSFVYVRNTGTQCNHFPEVISIYSQLKALVSYVDSHGPLATQGHVNKLQVGTLFGFYRWLWFTLYNFNITFCRCPKLWRFENAYIKTFSRCVSNLCYTFKKLYWWQLLVTLNETWLCCPAPCMKRDMFKRNPVILQGKVEKDST